MGRLSFLQVRFFAENRVKHGFREMQNEIDEFFHSGRLTKAVLWLCVAFFPLYLTLACNFLSYGSGDKLYSLEKIQEYQQYRRTGNTVALLSGQDRTCQKQKQQIKHGGQALCAGA